jgi:hypothetical protein
MSNHYGHKRQHHEGSSQRERRLSRFGGQSVPLSTSGTGRQILYRCPLCQHPWLQDGPTCTLRLSADKVRAKVESLHADPEHLPQMVCRLCLFEAGGSSFHIDEYRPATGLVSYGLVWEHAAGMSLQAVIRPLSTLADPLGPADVPLKEETLHAVLSWLADLDTAIEVRLFSMAENALLNRHMPVQSGWQWQALCLVQPCPPLADLAVVVLAEALPADTPLKPEPLVTLWKALASVMLAHLTGRP